MPIRSTTAVLAILIGISWLSVANASELALKRVLLSSGGVGYFEYEALVVDDGKLSLDIRLDQVDDVLKSVVVFDDKGGVGTISLPGREPLSEAFRALPFGPEALDSAVDLFEALTGAQIAVTGSRALEGRLISIKPEQVALPDERGTLTRHRVSLLTSTGVQQFILEEQDAVRLAEPKLQAQVAAALAAVAQHRVRDRRMLTIAAPGEGERRVRVGYVVSAPLWKASYRLGFADDAGRLQGWAVIENLSGQDWRGVDLTLASGNPVTFRQALYKAYFVDRPEVPVEVLGRVLPPTDRGTVQSRVQERRAALAKAAPQELAEADIVGGEAEAFFEPAPAPAPQQMAGGGIATSREEATTQVILRIGEPISLDAGESLMVPVIDEIVPAETVSLYQPTVHARHPLAAVRIVNATATGLPPGILTLYEAGVGGMAFVGDARLAPLPAGDARLLSFALDQSVVVDREQKSGRTVVGGAISKGSLRLSVRQSDATVYRVKSAAQEIRRLLIEHPRRDGWEVVEPAGTNPDMTDSAYRLPLDVAPGASAELTVRLERQILERTALTDLQDNALEFFAQAEYLDPPLRAAFERLAEQRATIASRRQEVARLERSTTRLFDDQKRLRDNLRNVPRDSDLHRRYLAKLTEQEDTLDRIATEIQAARDALKAAEDALAAEIRSLEL